MRSQIFRLARHSMIYGIGGIASRVIAIFLLPIYTGYLTTGDYGVVAVLIAAEAVAVIFLRAGVQSAFFRFYFDSPDPLRKRTVVRTAFWYTMTASTVGLVLGQVFAPQIASGLAIDPGQVNLVRAACVLLWADMNYQQQTALFRVEERSKSYVIASLSNVLITISSTIVLVVVLQKGALGLIVGNFTGTLCVYFALLLYRARLLGFEFDRGLYKAMEHFGLPLIPSALALWATRFIDRFFLNHYLGKDAVGVYSFGVTIASALVLIVTAFQLAWPAFGYSISDDREARHTYSYVLTYYLLVMTWAAVALSLLAPWIAQVLARKPSYLPGSRFVPLLVFGSVALAGYSVVLIGIGRVRRTRSNWIITGTGALVDVVLNIILIPRIGSMGAAIGLAAAYTTMFLGMSWKAQRLFPVPYQWRRVVTLVGAGVGLVVVGKVLSVPLPLAITLVAVYPLVLLLLGFYLASERALVARVARRLVRTQPAEPIG
jgi:O-antigen/teichoic acid export membrane protein